MLVVTELGVSSLGVKVYPSFVDPASVSAHGNGENPYLSI